MYRAVVFGNQGCAKPNPNHGTHNAKSQIVSQSDSCEGLATYLPAAISSWPAIRPESHWRWLDSMQGSKCHWGTKKHAFHAEAEKSTEVRDDTCLNLKRHWLMYQTAPASIFWLPVPGITEVYTSISTGTHFDTPVSVFWNQGKDILQWNVPKGM